VAALNPALARAQRGVAFRGCGAGGFMVHAAYLPGGLDDFLGLLIPELQSRGPFRSEYEGATLRDTASRAACRPSRAAASIAGGDA
jgi:hypothetical protein